jgi:hypothetical protein
VPYTILRPQVQTNFAFRNAKLRIVQPNVLSASAKRNISKISKPRSRILRRLQRHQTTRMDFSKHRSNAFRSSLRSTGSDSRGSAAMASDAPTAWDRLVKRNQLVQTIFSSSFPNLAICPRCQAPTCSTNPAQRLLSPSDPAYPHPGPTVYQSPAQIPRRARRRDRLPASPRWAATIQHHPQR